MYLLKVPFVSAVYYSNKRIFLLGKKKPNWYFFIIDQLDTTILFLNSALLGNKPHAWMQPFLCSLLGKEKPALSWSREGRRKEKYKPPTKFLLFSGQNFAKCQIDPWS